MKLKTSITRAIIWEKTKQTFWQTQQLILTALVSLSIKSVVWNIWCLRTFPAPECCENEWRNSCEFPGLYINIKLLSDVMLHLQYF